MRNERKRKQSFLARFMVLFMIINLLSGVNPSVVKADTAADTAHFKNYTLEQTDNATGVKLTQKASNYNNGNFDVEMTVEGNEDSTTKMHSLDVVLAIDTSNSMAEPKNWLGFDTYKRLKNAKKAAKSFTDILLKDSKNKVRVAVVGFGDIAYTKADLTSDKKVINKAIDSLKLTGATYTQDALKMADRILNNNSNADQKKIVLLSDGVPTYGYYKGEKIGSGYEVTDQIKEALYSEADTIKSKGISITTVGIGVDATGKSILERVAKDSGGYKAADEFGSNLDEILKNLAEEIVNKKVNNGKFVIPMADYVKFKDNLTYEVTTKGIKNENLTKAIKTTKPDSDKNLIFDGLTLGKYDKLIIKYKAELVEERKDGDYYNITKTSPELSATATATDKIVFDKIMQVKDLKTVNLVINKKWVGSVPTGVDSVEFNILSNNDTLNDKAKVKKDSEWNTTVTGLPRYKGGNKIVYQLKEDIPQDATYEVSKNERSDAVNGDIIFNVTNKNTEKVDYVVTKKWGNTPSELQFATNVQLYDGENKVNNRLVTLKDNNWTATFTDLPKYNDNGDEIKYSVKEVGDKEEEKEGKLTLQGYEYSVKHDTANATNQDTITNTVTNASKKTFTATVTKKWEGGISTNDVIFTFTNTVENKKYDLKLTPKSLNGENTWTGETQLPKYNDNDNSLAEYTVTEVAVPGFTTISGENKVVTASDPNVEFTNKRITKNINVTKEWGATPEKFIDEVTVVLTGTADNYSKKESIKIAKGENRATFTVPTHTLDGKEITYKATEQGEKDGEVLIGKNKFTVDYSKENTIVNTYTGLTTDSIKLKIIKKWDGEGRVPVEFEIKDEKGKIATDNKITINNEPWETTVTLPMWDKDGNLKKYTVIEVGKTKAFNLRYNKDFKNEISGKDGTVTFTNERVMRTLTVEKKWVGDEESITGKSANFKIKGGGKTISFSLKAGKEPSTEETKLPVYDLEGKPIEYTITEEEVEGFTADATPKTVTLTNNMDMPANKSVTFTNTKMIGKDKHFTVHKTWVGEPTASISFGLYNDEGTKVDTLELKLENAKAPAQEANVWEGTFEKEQPEYKLDKDGKPVKISYVVKELDKDGNSVADKVILEGRTFEVVGTPAQDTANTYNFKNKDITKTDISVTKTWLGKVPMRPLVKFGLYKENAGKIELVDKNNYKVENEGTSEWKVSFKEFPTVDEKGDKIKYVIKEVYGATPDAVNEGNIVTLGRTDYKVSYDAQGNITNTELLNITVDKVWDESVPQSERKSVEVAIYNGGTVVAYKELNSANEWKHTFTELPYSEDGYQVKETKINGINVDDSLQKLYTIDVEKGTGIKTSGEVKVTNSFKLPKAEEGKIKVLKQWTVNPTQEITVKLYKKTAATPAAPSIWEEVDAKQLNNGSVLETEFNEPTDAEDYQILETAIGGLVLTENEIQSILNSDDLDTVQYKIGEYEVSIQALDDDVFFIKNTNDNLLTEVTATKQWSAKTIEKNKKPVKVQLFAETNGVLEAIGSPVELNAGNQWSTKFKGLDKFDGEKEINYYVAEVGTEKTNITLNDITKGYKLGNSNVTITGDAKLGFVITNDVNLIDVTAEKVWENGATAVPVKFTLYRRLDNELTEVSSKILDGTQDWTVTFEDQPRVDETTGEDYFYYVFETEINNITVGINPLTEAGYEVDPLAEVITYTTGDINNGRYSVVIHGNAANGEKITVKNTFKPNVVPVIPGGVTPGGTPVIPVVTPDPLPTPTPNPSTPVVDVPNDPSPQGPATPVNDGDEDNGVTEIDEDDVPQDDGKEVKKDNKANKDTVEITDNKAPKGTANLPKTGGEAGNFLPIIGLGLIGLGLVIRRRR